MMVLEQKLELEQLKVCSRLRQNLPRQARFQTAAMLFVIKPESERVILLVYKTCSSALFLFFSRQESLTKLGVGCKDEVENWFTGEKLGLSGYDRLLTVFE